MLDKTCFPGYRTPYPTSLPYYCFSPVTLITSSKVVSPFSILLTAASRRVDHAVGNGRLRDQFGVGLFPDDRPDPLVHFHDFEDAGPAQIPRASALRTAFAVLDRYFLIFVRSSPTACASSGSSS